MNPDVVVRVEHLGKKFKIYKRPWDRMREWITRRTHYHTDFWALKDISFELKSGEALGIIGQNGAGKSTLLKILTGALYASEGSFRLNGRVLSMLELGTGFNAQLTGRENVYNSAHLLGFPENYVAERIDDIENFADIGKFFDRPIKMYSSGMYARLAFSMFAFLDCDLLVIDEVLSVGDTFFTQKCYERLDQLARQGTALIMVTHNLSVIQQYCRQAIVLDEGRLIFSGSSSEAAKHYFFAKNKPIAGTSRAAVATVQWPTSPMVQHSTSEDGRRLWLSETLDWPAPEAFLNISQAASIGEGWARCTAVALCDDMGHPCRIFKPGQTAHWYYEFEVLQDLTAPSGSVAISNDKNIRLHGKNTMQLGVAPRQPVLKGMRIRCHQSMELNIAPGDYTFSIGLAAARPDHLVVDQEASSPLADRRRFIVNDIDRAGVFQIMWMDVPYLGLCDLPGECAMEISTPPATSLQSVEVPETTKLGVPHAAESSRSPS